MKRVLLLFITFLVVLFVPNVYAAGNVSIESVELDSKTDSAIILNDATFERLTVSFDLKFNDVDDFVKYKLVINNPTDTDYEISKNSSFEDSEYISYEIISDNNSSIISKKSKAIFYITIKYIKKIPSGSFVNGEFVEANKLVINLGYDSNLKNPETNSSLIVLILLLLFITIGSLIVFIKTKSRKFLTIFVIGILLLPVSAYALEQLQITINPNIVIEKKPLAKDVLLIDYENNNYSPYVLYELSNGETVLSRVLYDKNSEYGLQIITANPIAKVRLGSNDPKVSGTGVTRAQNSYMRAITTLNEAALEYKDENGIASDARCVGSKPLDKNYPDYLTGTERTNLYWNTGSYHYKWWISSYLDKYFSADTNYQTDDTQLRLLGIQGFEDTTYSSNYWMASRLTSSVIAATTASYGQIWYTIRFGIRNHNSEGNYVSSSSLLFMREGVNSDSYDEKYNDYEFGLRPVFIIGDTTLVSKGDGTIANPYILEADE